MENKFSWRYTCKYSNCAIHNSQREDIDQAKILDFDPDAIQNVMFHRRCGTSITGN